MRRFQHLLDGLGLVGASDADDPADEDDDDDRAEGDEIDSILTGNVATVTAAIEAHLAEYPDDREALAEREAGGKNRAGVLKALTPSE